MREGLKKGVIRYNCSKCNKEVENKKKRYCNSCSAEYIKNWRKYNLPTSEQRLKNNVRRKTNMRIKRGLLIRLPCEVCGNEKVEAHHDDYNQPYNIRWLCLNHHREHHKLHK